MRGKSANDDPQEEADDPLNTSLGSVTPSNAVVSATSSSSSSSSSAHVFIKAKEDWENWYPMEWIAWTTFGVPSDEPTVHWVNEAIEDGPEVTEGRKKPLGRVDQRRKENELKGTTKSTTEISALRITETTLRITDTLLRRYPFTSEPGILCIQKFDPVSATIDYQLLLELPLKHQKVHTKGPNYNLYQEFEEFPVT